MPNTAPNDLSPEERQKIIGFLSSHPVGVLASVDADGNPHASTIYFAVDDELNITFTTKQNTQKHKNIMINNSVMIVSFDAASQASVQASGAAKKVTNPEEVQKIYHGTLKAARRTGEDVVPPIAKITAGAYVAFIIKPDNIWLTEYGWGNNFANSISHATDPESTEDPA